MIKLSILILVVLFLSTIINLLLSSAVGGFYRVFVAPGIILHELSHAFSCFITGSKVTNINLFKTEGGEVKHTKPKFPVFGQILISISPFIVGALAIYFLSKFIGIRGENVGIVDLSFAGVTKKINHTLSDLNLKNLKAVVAFYLIVSIAVTMVPSKQDIKNIFISLIILGIAIFAIIKYTSYRPNLDFLATPELLLVMSSIAIILLFAFILSIVVFVIASIFKA